MSFGIIIGTIFGTIFDVGDSWIQTIIAIISALTIYPYLAIEAFTAKSVVTEKFIHRKSKFKDQLFTWSEVTAIVSPNNVVAMPLGIVKGAFVQRGNEKLSIFVSGLKNGEEFVRITIELAKNANANIYIDPDLLDEYGYPPYGLLPDTTPTDAGDY